MVEDRLKAKKKERIVQREGKKTTDETGTVKFGP